MKAGIHKSAEGIPLDLIIEAEDEDENKILVELYAKQPKFHSIRSAPEARVQIVMPVPEQRGSTETIFINPERD